MNIETPSGDSTERVPLKERNIVQFFVYQKAMGERPAGVSDNDWADMQSAWYEKYGETMTKLIDEDKEVRALITARKFEEAARLVLSRLGIEMPEGEALREAA